VETPRLQRLPSSAREKILKTLKLAQDMGAETATLPGSDVAETVVEYARNHNLSKVMLGRDKTRAFAPWRSGYADRIAQRAPELDITQIVRDEGAGARSSANGEPARLERIAWTGYLVSAGVCVLTTFAASALQPLFELANIVMMFLLAVVLIAVRLGRGPAVLAAFLNVAAFDFFFVPPRFSFTVNDFQYLLTFAVMLAVALITGQLAAGLKYQARVAMNRELRARALYEMSRELSAALLLDQIAEIAARFVEGSFRAKVALLLADEHDRLNFPVARSQVPVDAGIAQWAFDHAEAAGAGTGTLPGSPVLYVPLKAPMRTRGVLAVQPSGTRWLLIPEQRRQLDTFATLIAIAIERVHYVDIAQLTTVQIESERLRNSLLSALSHDLRTPLTALVGLAEYLTLVKPELSGEQREVATAIRDEARRMTALVNNLLDMGRLQSGEVKLNRQWQPLEEVVGAALAQAKPLLGGHEVQVQLDPALPFLEFDAVLLERVLFNILENAHKYTPPGSVIRLSAQLRETFIDVVIEDSGPGLPEGMEEEIFKKFTRGRKESATPGVGLGLAVCRAIVEAHRGSIRAEKSALGGARFVFSLPLGNPPALDENTVPGSLRDNR